MRRRVTVTDMWIVSLLILIFTLAYGWYEDNKVNKAALVRVAFRFFSECEKSFPAYRCQIMWDSVTPEDLRKAIKDEVNQHGTP